MSGKTKRSYADMLSVNIILSVQSAILFFSKFTIYSHDKKIYKKNALSIKQGILRSVRCYSFLRVSTGFAVAAL